MIPALGMYTAACRVVVNYFLYSKKSLLETESMIAILVGRHLIATFQIFLVLCFRLNCVFGFKVATYRKSIFFPRQIGSV